MLAVSLNIRAWPAVASSLAGMWNAWLSSPDFSWRLFGMALAGHFCGLLLPLLLLVAMYGAGRGVARLFRIRDPFLGLALGLGAVSLAVQGLGYPGLHFHSILGITGLILIASGCISLNHDRPWREFAGEDWHQAMPKLAVLGGIIACGYMLGRLPDAFQDARTYHMAAPENFIFLHRIVAEPGDFSWHMPLGAEMSFLIPYAFGGITWAKQVNVAALLVLLGLVWRLSGALGRRSLWAPIWAGTASLLMFQCWEGKNDIQLAMYLTGALACAVRGQPLASAVLMGLAIGVKFTAGLMVSGLVAVLFLAGVPAYRGFRLALSALPGLAPVLGWLAASWLFVGNPFHPFLSGHIPEVSWNPLYQEWVNRFALTISPPETLLKRDWLLGIWRGTGEYGIGSAGLFWIMPAALLGAAQKRARIPVLAVLVAYLIWLPSTRVARYLLPQLPLFAAIFSDGGGITGFFSGWNIRWLRRFVCAYSVATALALSLLLLAPGGFLFLLGQKTANELLRDRFTSWDEARTTVNSGTPPGSRILLTGDTCRLWFDRRMVSTSFVGEPLLWKLSSESWTATEMAKKVRQRGLTHILDNFISGQFRAINWFPGPGWTDKQLGIYHDFISRYLRILFISGRIDGTNGGFYLYSVGRRERVAPPGRLIHHLPSTEGMFLPVFKLVKSGQHADATDEARRIDGIMGKSYHGSEVIGRIYAAQQRYREAKAALEPGIRAGFIGNSNLQDYCNASMYSGSPAEGARAMARLYRISGNERLLWGRADALVLVANALLSGQRTPVPAGNGQHERPLVPDTGNLSRDRLEKALKLLEQASWLDPEEPYFHIGIMQVLKRLGRNEEAGISGRRALRLSPDNREILKLVE